MSDKMTPTWADLAESLRWLDGKISRQSEVGYLLRGIVASFEMEAARREAEAKPPAHEHKWVIQNEQCVCMTCGRVSGMATALGEREGPGSAADDVASILRGCVTKSGGVDISAAVIWVAADHIDAQARDNAALKASVARLEDALRRWMPTREYVAANLPSRRKEWEQDEAALAEAPDGKG